MENMQYNRTGLSKYQQIPEHKTNYALWIWAGLGILLLLFWLLS